MNGRANSLKLGDFTFRRGEVPESIGFGASQAMHVHTLVGGERVIDAMGPVPLRPEWSGWFSGPQALARARSLKTLAEAGQPLPLRFGEFAYTVIIAAFSAEFRSGPHLPYSITLEVVRDHSAGGPGAVLPGVAQMVALDLANARSTATAVGDGALIACIGTIGAAVAGTGGSHPLPAAIRAVLPLIVAAQTRAAQLKIVASARLAALGLLAVPGPAMGSDPLGQFSAGLVAAALAANQSLLLNATTQALGRMTGSLVVASRTAGAGGAVLTTGSGDLYHLAASVYGDARGWTQIAKANQLTDPMIFGITELVIPVANAMPATGVLDA